MRFSLLSGLSGPEAHQRMRDTAGDKPANVNATDFKCCKSFSELLSETIKKASQATMSVGTADAQQTSNSVGTADISANAAQGNIVNTGNPLDLALEGEGYFVLSDGVQNVYTRTGAFGVDADSKLVDPATGYRIQRIGDTGEADGFQAAGNSNIHIPYDVTLEAKATSSIKAQGNLSADATFAPAQTQKLTSNITYTTNNGTIADGDTKLDELDQFSGMFNGDATLTVSGKTSTGGDINDSVPLAVNAGTDLNAVISHINGVLGTDATAKLAGGRIVVTGADSGYSQLDIKLTYSDPGDNTSLRMPAYFELTTVGGEQVKDVNIAVYDSLGDKHILSGAFVRTNALNTWDMVLTSITGDISEIAIANRRIKNIEFSASDGSYAGLNAAAGDTARFVVVFAHNSSNPQSIAVSMGTAGRFDGLTQLAGNSTAVLREQDGYEPGRLSSLSVDNEGTVIGTFSNGVRKNIAAIRIALFENPAALKKVGRGYYISSANSGEAAATEALAAGAGSVHSGALEKSSAAVAAEFVTMIKAQNGFQANAKTIRAANDVLRGLTNLIG